jgi:hypothetical protein
VSHKAQAPAHHAVLSMHAKADAWQRSSSPEYLLMALTPSASVVTERNYWVQFLLLFFPVHQWTIQNLHELR